MAGPGFRRLTAEQRREIAQKAGRTSQASGKGHRWTAEAAREAGRKGGLAKAARERDERTAPVIVVDE